MSEHFYSFFFWHNWTIWPLARSNFLITIYPHHKKISMLLCFFQIASVPDMHKIKCPLRKDYAQSQPSTMADKIFKFFIICHYTITKIKTKSRHVGTSNYDILFNLFLTHIFKF